MQYIIMLLIVVGLIAADYLTGIIKAYITNTITSAKMRKGGLNKLTELIVMGVAIGLTIGFDALGQYYSSRRLTDIAGTFTATGIFAYLTIMELISILENFAEINPQAAWIQPLLKKLNIMKGAEDNGKLSGKEE